MKDQQGLDITEQKKITRTTTTHKHEPEILENTGLLQDPTLLKFRGSAESKSLSLGIGFLQHEKKEQKIRISQKLSNNMLYTKCYLGFPGGTSGKEPACQCRRPETQVRSLGQEDPLEEGIQPTPIFLPGETRGQRRLEGHSLQRCKKLDMTEATWHANVIYYIFKQKTAQ